MWFECPHRELSIMICTELPSPLVSTSKRDQQVRGRLSQPRIEPNMIKSTRRFLVAYWRLCVLVVLWIRAFSFLPAFLSVPLIDRSLSDIEPSSQRLLLAWGCSFGKWLILHRDGVWGGGMMAESREGIAVCHIVNRDGCRSRPSWNTWQASGTEQSGWKLNPSS